MRFTTASLLDLRASKRRHQGGVGSWLQVPVTQAPILVSSPRVHLQTQHWGRAATETVKQKATNLARPSHCLGMYVTHVKINKKVRTNLHCQVNEQEASSIIFMAPQYGITKRKHELMLKSPRTTSFRIIFVAPQYETPPDTETPLDKSEGERQGPGEGGIGSKLHIIPAAPIVHLEATT